MNNFFQDDNRIIGSIIVLIIIFLISGLIIVEKRNNIITASVDDKTSYKEIYLGGAVKNPGFYMMDASGNLAQLVNLSGGFTFEADIEQVNLSRPLKDGDNIIIPKLYWAEKPADITTVFAPINVNTASLEELQKVPGIGPSTAIKIISYRENYGYIKSGDDLLNISGIGDYKLEQISPYICFY